MRTFYRYCGLLIASDLALPELPEAAAPAVAADMAVVAAPVPRSLAAATDRTATYEIGEGEALWRLDGVAHFRVADGGRRIEVDAAPLADAASVRLFLLQPVFALASVMRGDWMLNAAAVERAGLVTAFVGPSACGKSAAAAALAARGWRLVSDSLLRLTPGEGGMLAHVQAPWLLLRRDVRRHLGCDDTAGEVRAGLALRRVRFETATRPLVLRRVIVLNEQRGDDLELFETVARRGTQTMSLILSHVAGLTWLGRVAARHALFQWGVQLARQATFERVDMPWNLERLADLDDIIGDARRH